MTIKIQTALDKNALVVPPTVVQRGLDSHFVYRVNGDKVDVVPVQVTYQDSDVNIIKGVQAGMCWSVTANRDSRQAPRWKSSRSRRR